MNDYQYESDARTSNQQFSREQIEFIRNEMYASLSCGASDPLFQAIYDRAVEVLRSRDETPAKPSDDAVEVLCSLLMQAKPYIVSADREGPQAHPKILLHQINGALDRLQLKTSAPLNQCDGCIRGLPLNNLGHHVDGSTVAMSCTRERYL